MVTSRWVRTAHADAWQVLGVRATRSLPGVRLMATGLAHAQWNDGDIDDPALVDIDAVRDWYDDLGVPWGLRLPADAPWPHGRKILTKRLMGLTPAAYAAPTVPPRVTIRQATTADFEAYLHVDSTAFEDDPALQRPWLELLLCHPKATVAVAEVDGAIVASGQIVMSDDQAGPAAYVGGIAVLPDARRRGIGAAITGWLVERGFDSGAALAHLHPDTDHAAGIYQRLGFTEVEGFDVYLPIS